MDKQPMSRAEIERRLMAELHTFQDCEQALQIVVVPMEEGTNSFAWTVSCFKPGRSDGDACDYALQEIVPRLQREYDLVLKH